MKRFFGFVIKEFYHIFRDKRTMLILFGMPIAQILLFGYVITNEIRNVKIAVYDKSKDEITRKIMQKILSSGYFIFEKEIHSEDEIEKTFKRGIVKEVIVFDEDFSRKLERNKTASIHLIADASDANTANLIVNYTNAIIRDFQAKEISKQIMFFQIIPEVRMLYNENLKGAFMFVPGTMALILMLISAMMTSISITREKEFNTMETLLVSPLKPIQIIIGKVTPYIALSFVNAITIIVLGSLVFDVPVKGSLVLLLAETILFISMALSLGIMISTVAKTQQVAMFISMFALMLPTILLSGFIFPIENMPIILQVISNIVPPRWFIIIVKNIMLKGTGFNYVWKETLIIAGLTCIFIFISVKRFKTRLE